MKSSNSTCKNEGKITTIFKVLKKHSESYDKDRRKFLVQNEIELNFLYFAYLFSPRAKPTNNQNASNEIVEIITRTPFEL